ncbi:hypothetical protein BJ508DRAFT_336076 [Ascobolus immersus RN42]|uniref:Uncharacterized protein n=1 Tax=Ascobolus immersus RN42 TaxID=1160509 RepID=A0A3N4HEP5_ASCIM|nr:hypothetical protein BJ508DRAFT_336076 [Ascobolus immersus RN42]
MSGRSQLPSASSSTQRYLQHSPCPTECLPPVIRKQRPASPRPSQKPPSSHLKVQSKERFHPSKPKSANQYCRQLKLTQDRESRRASIKTRTKRLEANRKALQTGYALLGARVRSGDAVFRLLVGARGLDFPPMEPAPAPPFLRITPRTLEKLEEQFTYDLEDYQLWRKVAVFREKWVEALLADCDQMREEVLEWIKGQGIPLKADIPRDLEGYVRHLQQHSSR